jgi:hypothetical protein
MAEDVAKIIFVYNANGGKLNGLMDSAHKLVSPSTYSCELCAITHGFFGAKEEWKTFLNDLEIPVEFYHKDEWVNTDLVLPIILSENASGDQRIMVSADEMKDATLKELIAKIKVRLI